jgi:mycothiol synthase
MWRPYNPKDLPSVLTFAGKCLAASNFCNWHPGDIVHWMSNSHRGQNLSEYFWLYEVRGQMLAFAELPPAKRASFALTVHPEHRGGDFEKGLLEHCQDVMQQRMKVESINKLIMVSVAVSDLQRIHCLSQLDYKPDELDTFLGKRDLSEAIPEPTLPSGFSIRNVAGFHEAALLANVHNSAFTPKWTSKDYLEVMQTPGFEIEREMIVVAPDGQFAAFTIYWLDPITKSGLFEPVGCHKEFRKMGLTKALMLAVMQRMKDDGMQTALVGFEPDNEAATKLYASVGFKKQCEYVWYSKK